MGSANYPLTILGRHILLDQDHSVDTPSHVHILEPEESKVSALLAVKQTAAAPGFQSILTSRPQPLWLHQHQNLAWSLPSTPFLPFLFISPWPSVTVCGAWKLSLSPAQTFTVGIASRVVSTPPGGSSVASSPGERSGSPTAAPPVCISHVPYVGSRHPVLVPREGACSPGQPLGISQSPSQLQILKTIKGNLGS